MAACVAFMQATPGRILRVLLGVVLAATGLLVLGGTAGMVLALVGLAPIGLGVWGRCLLTLSARNPGALGVPPLIRRNTALLAGTQAFVGAGNQLVPTLGGIIIQRLLGSVALAGLPTSLLYLARLLIAYPIGWTMDAYGRKAGLLLGLALSLLGAVGVGLAVGWASLPLFLLALVIFGLGVGAGGQLRTAAADMYVPERRAEGLGYVLTGALLGALGGPLLIGAAQREAAPLRFDPTALAWLLVPAVLIPSIALVFLIRPDPKVIAANLSRFYPGYVPRPTEPEGALPGRAGLGAWLGHFPLLVGFVANSTATGIMVMMMAVTPLAMANQGRVLTIISLAVSIHVVGMYGLSLPLGRLADRVGRRSVILAGLAGLAAGTLLATLATGYWVVTAGLALVGLGWSCVNVAVTALIADTVPPVERGRAIGVVDSFGAIAAIVLPLAAGPLAQVAGFPALAALAAALVLGSGFLAWRLQEPLPGVYRSGGAAQELAFGRSNGLLGRWSAAPRSPAPSSAASRRSHGD